jgi:hypothetical protein
VGVAVTASSRLVISVTFPRMQETLDVGLQGRPPSAPDCISLGVRPKLSW